MEGDTTDWVWPQQGAVGGKHTTFHQEPCLCENEEVNIGIAVRCKFFGTSCEFSGQVGPIRFTVYEIAACQ